MTADDIEQLDETLKAQFGVDMATYRNEEVAGSFVALLLFPQYILTWMLLPILGALLLFPLGFFFLDLAYLEYLLYGVLGFVLLLALGILGGLLLLTWQMKSDIWGILAYSFEVSKAAGRDARQAKTHLSKAERRERQGLFFKGVIYLVSIPILAKAMTRRVPLIGGWMSWLMAKLLMLVANRINFGDNLEKRKAEASEASAAHTELSEEEAEKQDAQAKHSWDKRLKKAFDTASGILRFPFKLGFAVALGFFVLLIYWLQG